MTVINKSKAFTANNVFSGEHLPKNRSFPKSILPCIIPLIFLLILFTSCSKPLAWPDSPLYDLTEDAAGIAEYATPEEVKEAIVGHYAHYDVVAYEDTTTRTTMRTFIVSYGFTDFYLEDGRLMQSDRFIRAEQKLSQIGASSEFSDAAVQAIKPRVKEVELSLNDGIWQIHRPATPTLLGIEGDPMKPLSEDKNDPRLIDPDMDGHPGVTVKISVGKFFNGEIYLTRREIFTNYLKLHRDGRLTGYVIDESEQFIVGASMKILAQPSNSIQHPDMGLSPVILVPIDPEIDTAEELMELKDILFPPEPEFVEIK